MVIAGRRGGLGRAGDADEAARGSSRGQGSGSPGPDGVPDVPGEPCEHPCSLNGRRRGRRRTSIPPGRLYKKTVSRSRRRPSRPGEAAGGRRRARPEMRGVSTRVRSARCRCGHRRRRRLRRVPASPPCRRSAAGARTAESRRADNSGSPAACRSGPWRVKRCVPPSARSATTVTSRPLANSSASPSASPSIEKISSPVSPRLSTLSPGAELERQDAHADEVRAVDALVALGDHGADAQELRPLGRPVARRARAVLLARQDDQRDPSGVVALGRLEDRRHLAVGQVAGEAPLGPGRQLVAEADVGEGPADHHLVVAAARAVGVEVEDVDAVLDQVLARRALHLDRAGRRDVVGGDAVAQDRQDAGPADLRDRRRARPSSPRSTAGS